MASLCRWAPEVPTAASLGVIVVVLALTTVASLLRSRRTPDVPSPGTPDVPSPGPDPKPSVSVPPDPARD